MEKIFHWTNTFKTLGEDEDGSVDIKGLASTNAVDRAGDVINHDAWIQKNGLDNYKTNPKSLTEKELKMIGRHKSQQIKLPEVKPFVDPRSMIQEQTPRVPEKSLDQIIREKADERLRREQDAWDKEYGNLGLAKILRPE